jgi:MSHA biogenesis protein MshN
VAVAGRHIDAGGGGGGRDLGADPMSLINRMLQDLDARGGAQAGAAATQAIVKPALRGQRRNEIPLLLAGGALLFVLMAGGYYGWRALQRPAPVAAVLATAPTPIQTIILPPRQVPPAPAPVGQAVQEPAAVPADVAPPRPHAARKKVSVIKENPVEAPRVLAPKAEPDARPTAAAAGRTEPAPRAESEYRRALASLQEGRVGEAIASLEQVLRTDPRHEAARQTLVGLLIENRRPDEAARQLQQALGTDPKQPALAMLLARLQIERGWTGIETLQRTLPYATGNAEYQAFLAGALQRQQRHREAVEQYQAALRTSPGNGLWLMGLGISLQAEKRNAEAIDAFQKARSSPNLPGDLQGFVDRRLQQLSR